MNHHPLMWTWLIGGIALAGCTSTADDSGSSATGSDGAAACLAAWEDGVTVLDADGPSTQIHGTSAWDGEKLWVAWNRVDGGSHFDVWLQAVACDGSTVVAPIEVTTSGDNELDPVLAVSGERLLVAWTSDNGSGSDNLDIRYRVFDLDGQAQGEVLELAASRNGVAVTGNATQPAVAGHGSGFVMAGSWGHADATAFQVFAVELDADGSVLSDAEDAQLDTDFGQLYSALAVGGGGVTLAWQEDSTTSLAPAVEVAALGESGGRVAEPGARPSLAWSDGGLWSAWDSDGGEVWVQSPGGAQAAVAFDGGFVHSASLASAGGDPMMVAMALDSGIYNGLVVAALDGEGTLTQQVALDTDKAPAIYGIDLTLIDDAHAVVVFQDGDSPDFLLRAQWLTLER